MFGDRFEKEGIEAIIFKGGSLTRSIGITEMPRGVGTNAPREARKRKKQRSHLGSLLRFWQDRYS